MRQVTQLEKCICCGKLILRKISKILATRYEILRLKCTKLDLAVSKGPTKGKEGEWEWSGRGREGKGKGGRGGRGGKKGGTREKCEA